MAERMLGSNWKIWKLHNGHNPKCYCGTLGWSKGRNDQMKRANRSREKVLFKKALRDE